MRNTAYYHLNIVEGSDIVNPLTVDNPNYEIIDEAMHSNAVSGVTLATEIANATVHAITRENSDCAVIRFIATSEWKAGDTVTVDGVPVTALLPSGETLPDGAYVINSNVLCILTGTNMTVFAERKKTDNANEIKYKNTNVGTELDNLNSNFDYGTALPEPQIGVYGRYENVVAGFQRQGNIFNIVFKGQVAGVVDFYYTSFGIDAKYKLPTPIFGELINIITVDGASGGKLHVKASENALQLSASSSDTFFFSTSLILEQR